MSDFFKPTLRIKKSPQTTTAQDNAPSVLMDDTNYTMDDSRALMGGGTDIARPQLARPTRDKPQVRR